MAADISDGVVGAELEKDSDVESQLNRYYYTQDEQGSTVYITDKHENIKNEYCYDAWGNILDSKEEVHNRITYTGQQFDNITQQYYLRARFYNPVVGRFTQEDVYRGDGLNLYAYCGNNPVVYYDPSGYEICPEGNSKENNFNNNRKNNTETPLVNSNDPIRVYRDIETDTLNKQYEIVTKKGKYVTTIKADENLIVEMPFKGKGKPSTNSEGWLRDNDHYFNELYKNHPEYFSETNVRNLENGYSIVNDAVFRSYFPQYDIKGLRHKPLLHHHIGGGGQAIAIPQPLHPGSGGIHNNEKQLGIWGKDAINAERLQTFIDE